MQDRPHPFSYRSFPHPPELNDIPRVFSSWQLNRKAPSLSPFLPYLSQMVVSNCGYCHLAHNRRPRRWPLFVHVNWGRAPKPLLISHAIFLLFLYDLLSFNEFSYQRIFYPFLKYHYPSVNPFGIFSKVLNFKGLHFDILVLFQVFDTTSSK